MIKGIIFDFNGTLFFDSPKHEQAWNIMAEKLRGYPMSKEELTTNMHGRKNKEVLEMILGRKLNADDANRLSQEKEAIYRQMCIEDPAHFQLVEGAVSLFEQLKEKGIPMTIASASIKENMDFFITHFHLANWFDTNVFVYDDGSYRNKTDMFLQSAKNLDVTAKECVIIEDSVSGVQCANAVEAYRVIVINEHKEWFTNLRVDAFISDFANFNIDQI